MFNLRLWAARLFAALRPRRPPSSRRAPRRPPLQLEPLSDRVMLSASPGLGAASFGLEHRPLREAWAKVAAAAADSSQPTDPALGPRPSLVLSDGSSLYFLTLSGKNTLSISRGAAPAGSPAASGSVSFETGKGGLDLTITFGASARFRLSLGPTDDSAPAPPGGFAARVLSLTGTLQTGIGEVVVQLDFDRHEFKGWLEGVYSLRLEGEAAQIRESDRPRASEVAGSPAASEIVGPGPTDAPEAAPPDPVAPRLPASNLDGRRGGLGRAPEDGQADPTTADAAALDADLAAEPPGALTPEADWKLPDAQAELAPLSGADRALVPAFVVGGRRPDAAAEPPRREEMSLNLFVIGLGEPAAAPRGEAPADRLFAEPGAATEGNLRVPAEETTPSPPSDSAEAAPAAGGAGASAGGE
jgi:hypothetical protein